MEIPIDEINKIAEQLAEDEEIVLRKDEDKLSGKKRRRNSSIVDEEALAILHQIAENTKIKEKVTSLEEGLKKVKANNLFQKITSLEHRIHQILSISSKEELMELDIWRSLAKYFT